MTTTRKQHSPQFKARVVIEAIRGEKTLRPVWGRSSRCIPSRLQSGGRRPWSRCRNSSWMAGHVNPSSGEADSNALYEEIAG